MKVVAALEVNPKSNALGLGSRALEKVAGRCVLERVIERVRRVEGVDVVVVMTSRENAAEVEKVNLPDGVKVMGMELRDIPRRARLRQARKWALSCWRGGIGNASYFDEQGSPYDLLAAAEETGADSVLWVPETGALFDPDIASGMIRQQEKNIQIPPFVFRHLLFTFSQAPPGLAGVVYHRDFLKREGGTGGTPGDIFAYNPEQARRDPVEFACNYEVPEAVRFGPFRFTADGRWGMEMLEEFHRLVANAEEVNAAGAVRETWERPELRVGRFPKEVKVEVTTRCNLSCNFCPRGGRASREMDMDFGLYSKLVRELGEYDDVRLTLSGLGEPLLHPRIAEMIKAAREAGVFGIHVETDGLLLEGKLMEEVLQAYPDMISVSVDANRAETYRALKGGDAFERACGNVEGLVEVLKKGGEPSPLPCVSMVKLPENEGEMEGFFDRWYGLGCWPVIKGYNDFAGQMPQRNPLPMTLAERIPCRKLEDEMTVLADGRVVVCSQDCEGRETVGDLRQETVGDAWNSERMWTLRREQQRKDFCGFGLCRRCVDWYYV